MLGPGRRPVAIATPRLPPPPPPSPSVPLLTTAPLCLSTSTQPSSRLPSRLGPLLPDSTATGFSQQTTLATCATLSNAHAQWTAREFTELQVRKSKREAGSSAEARRDAGGGGRRRKRKYDAGERSRKMSGAGRLAAGGFDWRGPGLGGWRESSSGD